LKFAVAPDVKREIAKRPELLDALAGRELLTWMDRMERMGYTMVSRPSALKRRPSPDPKERGWDWYVMEAKWFHHGPVQVLTQEDHEAKREEEQKIGARQLKTQTGVGAYLAEREKHGREIDTLGGDIAGAD